MALSILVIKKGGHKGVFSAMEQQKLLPKLEFFTQSSAV
jgi:hypothetical protein